MAEKRQMRLTESEFRSLIEESVKQCLQEVSEFTRLNAMSKTEDILAYLKHKQTRAVSDDEREAIGAAITAYENKWKTFNSGKPNVATTSAATRNLKDVNRHNTDRATFNGYGKMQDFKSGYGANTLRKKFGYD